MSAIIGRSILISLVFKEQGGPNYGSQREYARLTGPVRIVVLEEVVVQAAGDTSGVLKSERVSYDREGNRIGYERDTLINRIEEERSSNPVNDDISHPTYIPRQKSGFRILPQDEPIDHPLRARYVFDFLFDWRYEHYSYDKHGLLSAHYLHQDRDYPTGRTTSLTRYGPEGQLQERDITRYNQRGDYIEKICFDSTDTQVLHWTYTYDRYGNLTEMTSLDESGTIEQKTVFTYVYDRWGNWTQRTSLGLVLEMGEESTFITRAITQRSITYY